MTCVSAYNGNDLKLDIQKESQQRDVTKVTQQNLYSDIFLLTSISKRVQPYEPGKNSFFLTVCDDRVIVSLLFIGEVLLSRCLFIVKSVQGDRNSSKTLKNNVSPFVSYSICAGISLNFF